MAHPNAEMVRAFYDAFLTGNVQVVLDAFDDEVVLHVPGKGPLAGTYKGKEQVINDYAMKLMELSNFTFRVELHDVLATDEHTAAFFTEHAERDGKKLDGARFCELFHIRDGKAVEIWLLTADQQQWDEFWS